MKKISMIVGLLCFPAGKAPSATFEEQVARGVQKVSRDAGRVAQSAAASGAQAAPSPTTKGQSISDYEDLSQVMRCYTPVLGMGVVVIRDAETFQRRLADFAAGNRACGAELPKIDFSRRSVLGLFATGGGCDIKFERAVSRDDAAKKIVLSVVVLSEGPCEMLGMSMNWVSVPAIPKDYEVTGAVVRAGAAQPKLIRPIN